MVPVSSPQDPTYRERKRPKQDRAAKRRAQRLADKAKRADARLERAAKIATAEYERNPTFENRAKAFALVAALAEVRKLKENRA